MNRLLRAGCAVALTALATSCGVKDAVDSAIDEIQKTRDEIAKQSDAWRDALPKLVDQLGQLESQAASDVKTIVGDSRNQVQDLVTDTIKLANINAQEIVAKTGVEFRCNVNFTLNGVAARLQYLIDDLKFWKLNKRHSDKKPTHAICQVLGETLALYPQSGGTFGIDSTKLVSPNVVQVFGYNFRGDALPRLDLVSGSGAVVRAVNVSPAYVTQYQIVLDFAAESFAGATPGSRVVFRWPDETEPNTITLALLAPAKVKILSAVFSPPTPIATKDNVTLTVTLSNTGNVPSGAFTVNWTPQGGGVKSVSELPIRAGESRTVVFPPFTYATAGPNANSIALSSGDDVQSIPVTVLSNVLSFQDYPITRPKVTQPWTPTGIRVAAGDTVEIIAAGGCVNTHGSGDTTKRYVDPFDESAGCRVTQRKYFGTIAIPGTIEEGARRSIRDFMQAHQSLRVIRDAIVELGYVDDGYGDNDYNDFDQGTCGQCRGQPPAFVTIRVTKFR